MINADLYAALNSRVVSVLDCMFLSKTVNFQSFYEKILHKEQHRFTEIAQEACKLSYMIQQGVVTYKLVVTLAPAGDVDVLRTHGFGLVKMVRSTCVTLVEYQTRLLHSVVDQF